MAAARPLKIAGLALVASTAAVVQLPSVLDPSSATASPPLDVAVLQILLPFLVMESLFAALPFLYRRHARRAAAAADGNNRRRLSLSELVAFISCVAVSLLEHFLFVRPAGGAAAAADGGAAQARRALGLAALRVLPASAFFLGVALVYAHLAGGNRPVPEPAAVRILAEMTLDAAAALICIMAVAVCTL